MINSSGQPETIPTCTLDDVSRQLGRDIPEKVRLHLGNWAKFDRSGGAPSLAELFGESDPATQPWLVVIDTEREDAQNIRLVGTAIVEFFGFDATGYDFLQSVVHELRSIFVETHRRITSGLVGKFHLAVCSTSTGRELEVLALALPYERKNGVPCAAWLLLPGAELKFGETGSQVRAIIAQFWIDLGRGSVSRENPCARPGARVAPTCPGEPSPR